MSSMVFECKQLLNDFGKSVRNIRKEKSISQEELASLCDFDRTYISLIERGLRNPSLTTVFRIAYALEKHPSDLFVR